MNKKQLARVEIKDGDKGEVAAVFSTFNAIDSDKDVTLPGAFEDGAPLRISAYGHESWFGALPVGKGAIRELKTEAIMEGVFFVDTQHGLDTFKTVKAMSQEPNLQEWSYGYDVIDSDRGDFEGQQVRFLKKLKVHEVSPVLLGAGVNTRTLSVKGDTSFIEHAATVMADVRQLIERATKTATIRITEGKQPSERTSELMGWLEVDLKALADLLRGVPGERAEPEYDAELAREYLRYIQRSA